MTSDDILYTPSLAGSGQFAKCAHCKKNPIVDGNEVYDGCLGKLDTSLLMNACCGHSDNSLAYVQFWNGECIRGEAAIILQKALKEKRDENP